jgi:S-adenosylmethionine/arginine decarboxylase-like enzyme
MIWQRLTIPPVDGEVPFGTHVVLDIRGCDRQAINDYDALNRWVTGLVRRIGMTPFGEPRIPHFGHSNPVTSGYSVDQLLEESNIMAHLSPHTGSAFADIFSCGEFDPDDAASFTVAHLGGTHGRMIVIAR